MKAIYNFKETSLEELHLNHKNRAFLYGDGLFETIIYKNSQLKFFNDHIRRIKKGMKVLGIQEHHLFNTANIEHLISQLLSINNLTENVRIKLQVWRKPGGLYTPTSNHFEMLITAEPFSTPDLSFKKNIDFCKNVYLTQTTISKFKTCNSLPYIIAGIEKDYRKLDDLIILDQAGNVSECISSNIFWKKDDVYYTPSLKTGCIGGVMRKNIIKTLRLSGYTIKKGRYTQKKLLKANAVFLCNVTGIYQVESIGSIPFKSVLEECLQKLL